MMNIIAMNAKPTSPVSSMIDERMKSFWTSGRRPSLYVPFPIPFPVSPPSAIAPSDMFTCQFSPCGSRDGKTKLAILFTL